MIADFSARSSLHGQSILLNWVWKSADLPASGFRLVRFPGRYEESPERGEDLLSQFTQLDLENLVAETGIDPSTGENYLRFSLEDKNLEAGIYYYYTLSTKGLDNVTYPAPACALSTKQYGLSEQLYRLLPGILKLYDNPVGAGPLKRFLELFGLTLDQARGYAESLSDRHDIFIARADLLPHLADLIGWNLDRTLDIAGQRHELSYAPEVHQTLGTLPILRAMVNRATGWNCQVKEFAQSVFLSNAPEQNRVWEIWSARLDKNAPGKLKPLHQGEGKPLHQELGEWFEGRPAVIKTGKILWVFWSSSRYGRRQIYLQRFNAATFVPSGDPEPVTPFDAVFGIPECMVVDDDPAVTLDANDSQKLWLFWSSNRSGNWDIWARQFDLTQTERSLSKPKFEFTRITYHQAEDRRPAVIAFNDSLWLFWQSNRRGPMDIWMQKRTNQVWSNPEPLTESNFREESPAVTTDGKSLWLAWQSQSKVGTEIRCKSLSRVENRFQWGAHFTFRLVNDTCEAPAIACHGGNLYLFYHATVNGKCNLWMCTWPTSSPFIQTSDRQNAPITAHLEADKEPAVLSLGNEFLIFWRSQERGKYFKSRTVSLDSNDKTDQETLSLKKTFNDRLHYTYDPGLGIINWYSLNTVGIYLQPENPDKPDEILVLRDQDRTYIESIIKEFLPVHVRALLFLSQVVSEQIYVYSEGQGQGIADEYSTDITTQLDEIYSGMSSEFYDMTPDWHWLRAWFAGLNLAEREDKIGKTNDKEWRTVHTNFKIPPTGG